MALLNLDGPPREPRWVSWLYFATLALVLILMAPLTRELVDWVTARWSRAVLGQGVLVLTVIVTVALVAWRGRVGHRLSWRNRVWLAMVGGVFVTRTLQLMRLHPEEALHFVEYAALSFFAYRLLSHDLRDRMLFLCGFLLTTLFGSLDEIVQWLVPGRYFGYGDIGLNATAALLVQVGLAFGFSPTFVRGWASRPSLGLAARLAACVVAVLLLCHINTPPRVEWYARRVPVLAYLSGNPSVMTEYGYRFGSASEGLFYSRLTPAEIARIDLERADQTARTIDRYRYRYPTFQHIYTSGRDPFVHELRVHLFRRDRYLAIARCNDLKIAKDGRAPTAGEVLDRRRTASVAYWENRFVEKHYPNTLARSAYLLSAVDRAYLDESVLLDEPYTSAVSAAIVHRLSEPAVWSLFGLVLLALLSLDRFSRRPPEAT